MEISHIEQLTIPFLMVRTPIFNNLVQVFTRLLQLYFSLRNYLNYT